MNVFDVIGIVAIPVAILCFHNWVISERLNEAERQTKHLQSIPMKYFQPTYKDSRTGAILPTREHKRPHN